MTKIISTIVSILFIFSIGMVNAGDLVFPTTVEEIIDALTLKDRITTYEGVKYESKGGRVYKMIGDKRFRVRGLKGIADAEIVPKVAVKIIFDINSSDISPDSFGLLNNFGVALSSGLSRAVVQIAGHTDSKGDADYNKKLSLARAESVSNYLIQKHNINPQRLEIIGYGESKPIEDNATELGRAQNRRVEFIRFE